MFRSVLAPILRRTLVTSAPVHCKDKPAEQRVFKAQPGGHPPGSNWLQWTDWQPIQEHSKDVKLKHGLKLANEAVVAEEETAKEPQLDKLYKTIELEALAYEPAILDSYEWFVVTAANALGITVGKRWKPEKPDKFHRALLRSVHVHKKHQVHYEIRTYHRFINVHKLTGSTADTFLEYIERNLPEGVGLKVTKFEVTKVPDFLIERSDS